MFLYGLYFDSYLSLTNVKAMVVIFARDFRVMLPNPIRCIGPQRSGKVDHSLWIRRSRIRSRRLAMRVEVAYMRSDSVSHTLLHLGK